MDYYYYYYYSCFCFCCCYDDYDAGKYFSTFRQISFSVITVIILAVLLSLHSGFTVIFTSLWLVTSLPPGSTMVGLPPFSLWTCVL